MASICLETAANAAPAWVARTDLILLSCSFGAGADPTGRATLETGAC